MQKDLKWQQSTRSLQVMDKILFMQNCLQFRSSYELK